ncbi:MAG TPA: hypothetical protein VHV47_06230 [Opitutaceae bacterium]|jgi:hypothetical protein|nr:hypothetical protein [Opitutaceae bacterium]
MKPLRLLAAAFAACLLAVSAFAADPSGTWKWTVPTPNGDLETTLKLAAKDGKLSGSYSNSFGDAAISNGSVKDDAVAFEVVRDFNGGKFVLKYSGKISGDTIKGSISVPAQDGSEGQKLPWNAKRAPAS